MILKTRITGHKAIAAVCFNRDEGGGEEDSQPRAIWILNQVY
jgi:hypothetical protein